MSDYTGFSDGLGRRIDAMLCGPRSPMRPLLRLTNQTTYSIKRSRIAATYDAAGILKKRSPIEATSKQRLS